MAKNAKHAEKNSGTDDFFTVKSYKSRTLAKERAESNLKFANSDISEQQYSSDVKALTGRVKSLALNKRIQNQPT